MAEHRILQDLQRLPIAERLTIIEAALEEITDLEKAQRRIKRYEMKSRLAAAADKAVRFYETDSELTAFTSLDSEEFIDNE